MQPQRKLLHAFLRRVALAALGVGLLLCLFQGWQDQQRHLLNVERAVTQVLDSALPSATVAAYSIDPSLAQSVVNGLTQRTPIIKARIVSDFDTILAEETLKEPNLPSGVQLWLLHQILGNDYTVSRPLMGALLNNTPLPVGELEITISPALAGDAFLRRTLLGLLSTMVQTISLCAVLTWVYLHTTLRPFTQIIRALKAMSQPDAPALQDLPVPPDHSKDEIGYLVESFNQLLHKAAADLNARRLAEASLRTANEQLEVRVAERTSHLNREISERKAAETALRISESRFRDLAEVSSDWFWESDQNGRLTLISDRFLSHTGLGYEQVKGKTLADLIDMGTITLITPSWPILRRQILTHQSRLTFEVSLATHDGHPVHAIIAGKRFVSATGQVLGYRGTGHDITRHYEDAEKLRLAHAEAERANTAKSEFLANMSHELRTPMNAILGFAQLLLLPRAVPLEPTQTQYVQHIIDAGDHLLGLINEVLDLARIESGHLELSSEPLDMAALAVECLDMVAPLAEQKTIALLLNQHPLPLAAPVPPLMALGDRVRLKQVVLNLLSNAIKYNRPAGQALIELQEDGASYITVSVTDTGIGIPPEHLSKVFDPFHRVASSTQAVEGTGIGLAVTRRLVEAMGGSLSVTSTEDVGSRFWFTVPRVSAAAITAWNPVKKDRPSGQWWTGNGQELSSCPPLIVLYIEDNPANQDLMHEVLQAIGNVTLSIQGSARAALSWAHHHQADVVFSDINLPDMPGTDLLQKLRQIPGYEGIPIVAISANARGSDIAHARGLGFDDYLCKPFNIADIAEHIAKVRPSLPLPLPLPLPRPE